MKRYMDVVQEAADLHHNGDLAKAAFLYEGLLGNQPDDPAVLYMYGTLFSQLKHYGTSILMLQKAVDIEPKAMPEAWHNLGSAYRNEGHTEKARECYKACMNLRPDNADTIAMMAGSYVNTGQPGLAIEYANRALAIDAKNCHAHNHKALALLELGRYEDAWPHYENRYHLTDYIQPRPFTCPKWDGETPVKKLAIHGEQGIGDEIMFMSCLEDIRATGLVDQIVVECASRLVGLFEQSFIGTEFFATYDLLAQSHPDCDAYLPMGSMPTLYRQTSNDFPGHQYLSPDNARFVEMQSKLKKMGGAPYVGVAWHGGTKATHQELRNPPIEKFAYLVEQIRKMGGTPISVQYGEDGAAQAKQLELPHWRYAIDDLVGQAALIKALDLVITPCQTAVHLAGAVGTECWCLTPSAPAWRYKTKGEMDWYQSVDLIRQKGNDWTAVFDTVMDRLEARHDTCEEVA